jgi:hypothetical protein
MTIKESILVIVLIVISNFIINELKYYNLPYVLLIHIGITIIGLGIIYKYTRKG